MDTPAIHRFEQAGLGKAPFRFVGVERRVGPLQREYDGVMVQVGAPGQPMGTCDYCGEGIADCCVIRSSDGKTFIVGNVCVGKTGDAGLKKVVDAAIREQRRNATAERARLKVVAAHDTLADPTVQASLTALPHPYDYMAAKGLTRLDWAQWMLANAGTRGKLEVATYLLGVASEGVAS